MSGDVAPDAEGVGREPPWGFLQAEKKDHLHAYGKARAKQSAEAPVLDSEYPLEILCWTPAVYIALSLAWKQ